MGTRADFYLKTQKKLRADDWLGSIAWDGYPEGLPDDLKQAKTPREFTDALLRFVKDRTDFTSTKEGWPWPWDSGDTTDYSYVFSVQANKVIVCSWGSKMKFPDMKDKQKVQYGNKSGLIIISHK